MLFTGELLKLAERFISDGVHPRIIADGFDLAKERVNTLLDSMRTERAEMYTDREMLINIARTSLRTKLRVEVRWQGHNRVAVTFGHNGQGAPFLSQLSVTIAAERDVCAFPTVVPHAYSRIGIVLGGAASSGGNRCGTGWCAYRVVLFTP